WAAYWCQDMRPVKNNIASLIETVKYASKTFTEPDIVKKSESKAAPKIYVKALHNIFIAMKGLRIFERFGFNLTARSNRSSQVSLIGDYTQWVYDLRQADWVNCDGQKLTDFAPLFQLMELLNNNIETVLE
ncbi:MAG: hypothetical protein ACXWCZ_10300, partial [Flavisolibacter sp.]